jgi:hypothetical protein
MEQTLDQTLELLSYGLIAWHRFIEDHFEVCVGRDHFYQSDVVLVVERKRVDVFGGWKHLLTRHNLVIRPHHLFLYGVDTHMKIFFSSVRVGQL